MSKTFEEDSSMEKETGTEDQDRMDMKIDGEKDIDLSESQFLKEDATEPSNSTQQTQSFGKPPMKRSIKLILGSIISILIITGIVVAIFQISDEETVVKEIPESALNSKFGYMAVYHDNWQDLEEVQERYNSLSWERAHPGFANWQVIEPTKGDYHWEDIDQYVKTTQEKDRQILFTVWPFTDWDQEICNSDLRWDATDFGKDSRDFQSLSHRSGMICDMEAYKEFLRKLIELVKEIF